MEGRGNIASRGVSTQPARTIKDRVESRAPANPLFLRDEELRQGIELMFYAYRDFTFESDQQLRHYQLGRAHHRAIPVRPSVTSCRS